MGNLKILTLTSQMWKLLPPKSLHQRVRKSMSRVVLMHQALMFLLQKAHMSFWYGRCSVNCIQQP